MPKIKYDPSCMDDYDPASMDAELAQQHILNNIIPVSETESVAIRDALHRVVSDDIRSTIDVPSHTNSAMDGYAIRAEDIPEAGIREFKLIGTAWAGRPYDGEVNPAECIRIMTGAAMPKNTDTVVMQEQVQVNDDHILIDASQKSGQNVRQAGEDIAENDLVFKNGKYLQAADIGLIASLGIGTISVIRKLRVAFFSTGDELVSIGKPLKTGQIYDSNRYTLWCMLERLNVEIIDLGVVKDTPEDVEQAFIKASERADIIITSGGVSVGDADFVKSTLEKLGEVNFWKVSMKPGRPLAFGKINNAIFFGLPGNPVSAVLTMYVLVQPMLAKLAGHAEWKAPESIPATTRTAFKKAPGRTDYQRGVYTIEDGKFVVETTGNQSSGAFRSMSLANCFVVLERERGRVEVGETVNIQLFNSTLY